MNPELFTKVMLDRPWRIRFSNRSLYRIQTLERPMLFSDIGNPQRFLAALAQWLWACLDEANPFDTPEKVADVINLDRQEEITQALIDCVNMGQPKDAKNDVSSMPLPSPASSSG